MVIKLKYSNRIFDLYMRLSHKTITFWNKIKCKEKKGGMGTFRYPVKV